MGSSSSSSSTYQYFGTIAGVVCQGPVDALIAVIVNDKELWPGGSLWEEGKSIKQNSIWLFNHISYIASTSPTGHWPYTAADFNQPGTNYWTEYTLPRGNDIFTDVSIPAYQNVGGTMRIYWGTQDQVADPLLAGAIVYVNNPLNPYEETVIASGNNYSETHPDYKGICYIVLRDFSLGQSTSGAPNIEVVVRRSPVQSIVTDTSLVDGQANLAAVLCEVLTSQNMLGISNDDLYDLKFQIMADNIQSNIALAGASVLIDSQDSSQSILSKITDMVDNFLRFNPSRKQIESGIYLHGTPPNSFTTITNDDLSEKPKLKSNGWTDVYTRAVVAFSDRGYNYTNVSTKIDDLCATRAVGFIRSTNLDRPWITRRAQAEANGLETLRSVGHPPMTGEISTRREIARGIKAGDYILLSITLEPNVAGLYAFFRVNQKTVPHDGPITLTITADNTLAPIPYSTAQSITQSAETPIASPYAAFAIYDDYKIVDGNGMLFLMVRQDAREIGFEAWFDINENGSYVSLGRQASFASQGVLNNAPISATETTFQYIPVAIYDKEYLAVDVGDLSAENDDLLLILIATDNGQVKQDAGGCSIVEVCSIQSSVYNSGGYYVVEVLRGRRGTFPIDWGYLAHAFVIPRANLISFKNANFSVLRNNRINSTTPNTAYFRFVMYSTSEAVELSDADTYTQVMPKHPPKLPVCTMGSGYQPWQQKQFQTWVYVKILIIATDSPIAGFHLWFADESSTDYSTPTYSYDLTTAIGSISTTAGSWAGVTYPDGVSCVALGFYATAKVSSSDLAYIVSSGVVDAAADICVVDQVNISFPVIHGKKLVVAAYDTQGRIGPKAIGATRTIED